MSEEKPDKIHIVVTLDQETRMISIAGPTANKLLCAHMLVDALKAIMDSKVPSPIITPGIVGN